MTGEGVRDVLEYTLKVLAVVVVVSGAIGSGLVLLLSPLGMAAAFVLTFALFSALGSGTALLATSFLFPGVVSFSSLSDLLWLVVPPSLASAILFDLVLERGLLSLLERTGLGLSRIHMTEAFVGGLFLGTALSVTAAFLTDVRVSPAAALAAGLISAFIRYYLGLWLGDRLGGSDDAELSDEQTR